MSAMNRHDICAAVTGGLMKPAGSLICSCRKGSVQKQQASQPQVARRRTAALRLYCHTPCARMQPRCWGSSRGASAVPNILLEPVPAPASGWRNQCQRSQCQSQLLAAAARLCAGAAQAVVGAVSKGSPLGNGSAAKSSGWKRSSIWQILCKDRPGTTSDRMARSVSTSFGIISRSAVARSLGK